MTISSLYSENTVNMIGCIQSLNDFETRSINQQSDSRVAKRRNDSISEHIGTEAH